MKYTRNTITMKHDRISYTLVMCMLKYTSLNITKSFNTHKAISDFSHLLGGTNVLPSGARILPKLHLNSNYRGLGADAGHHRHFCTNPKCGKCGTFYFIYIPYRIPVRRRQFAFMLALLSLAKWVDKIYTACHSFIRTR